MPKKWYFCILFFSLSCCSTTHSTQIFSTAKLDDLVLYPPHFLSEATLPVEANAGQKRKAVTIQKLIEEKVSTQSPFSLAQVERMVAFIDFVRKHFSFRESIYIHPDEKYLFVPVQLYLNGHVYLHLSQIDPWRKSGGYKIFSHSIDYDSDTLYANLVLKPSRKRESGTTVKEIEIMESLHFLSTVPHLRDYGFFRGNFGGKELDFGVQMDLFEKDLYERKKSLYDIIPIIKTAILAIEAVSALHEQGGYVHRDIKPKNFFWKNEKNHEYLVLADLGAAEHFSDREMGKRMIGTRSFMAPEMLLNRLQNGYACFTFDLCKRADIFALGMTLLEVLVDDEHIALKKSIHDLNLSLAVNKIKDKEKIEIHKKYNDYKELHAKERVIKSVGYSTNPHEAAELAYRSIIWQMLHPDPQSRPNLQAIHGELLKILSEYAESLKFSA